MRSGWNNAIQGLTVFIYKSSRFLQVLGDKLKKKTYVNAVTDDPDVKLKLGLAFAAKVGGDVQKLNPPDAAAGWKEITTNFHTACSRSFSRGTKWTYHFLYQYMKTRR